MTLIKLDQTVLDSPRQELSNDGLGIVVALAVSRQLIFCMLLLGVQSRCKYVDRDFMKIAKLIIEKKTFWHESFQNLISVHQLIFPAPVSNDM